MRVQLLLSVIGAAIVGGLIGLLAFTSAVNVVPDVGGVYVEGIVGQPRFLNPLLVPDIDFPAQTLDSLIFSGLTHPGADGLPGPDLAESWTVTPDGKQYTFYLRPNILWHDGAAFAADDVLYTIQAIQAKD